MRILNVLGAAAIGLGLMGFSAQAATIDAGSDFFADDGGVADANHDLIATALSVGDVLTAEVNSDTDGSSGSFAFEFTATQALNGVETNSINPISGFLGATAAWASDETGTTIFSSLTTAQLIAGDALVTSFLAGESKWLIITWASVGVDSSNFDLRLTAVAPIPGAAWLFGTALLGGGIVAGRRRRRQTKAAAA